MHLWVGIFIVFATAWDCASSSADFKCYMDLLSSKLRLDKLQSEYNDMSIHHVEDVNKLNEQIKSLQGNMSAWTTQTKSLSNDNNLINNDLIKLNHTYNDAQTKLSQLQQLVESTQGAISTNVDKRTNIAYANEKLTTSTNNLLYNIAYQSLQQISNNRYNLQNVASKALVTGLDGLNLCQQDVATTSNDIMTAASNRIRAITDATSTKQMLRDNEMTYATYLRQYEGLEFCVNMDMNLITGTAVAPYMIKLCEILDLDEIQSCRANVTAYEHKNTVATAQIESLEESIDNKSCKVKKYAEETKACDYNYRNCKAFLGEKQMIVEHRKDKEAEDISESLNIYHALQAALEIHADDERFKEMTRIMTKLDDRVIYSLEADFVYRLRTDLIQLYIMQSRTYLCNKLNRPCASGQQCVLRPFDEMFRGQSDAFTKSIKTTLKAVNGTSARFYAKEWSLGYFGIPPFLTFDDSKVFPPADLTKGYILLPQHIIFQSHVIDLLDLDIDLTRWLFEMKNSFGIPSPSPQERFFIHAMNNIVNRISNTFSVAEEYVKCKCISCDQAGPIPWDTPPEFLKR